MPSRQKAAGQAEFEKYWPWPEDRIISDIPPLVYFSELFSS